MIILDPKKLNPETVLFCCGQKSRYQAQLRKVGKDTIHNFQSMYPHQLSDLLPSEKVKKPKKVHIRCARKVLPFFIFKLCYGRSFLIWRKKGTFSSFYKDRIYWWFILCFSLDKISYPSSGGHSLREAQNKLLSLCKEH